MNSQFGLINWTEVKNGLVLALLTALVAIIINIINVGNIFGLDWKVLANTGALAFLVFFVSTLKDLLTTQKGNLVGLVKIK